MTDITNGMRIYCGAKENVPRGSVRGSPNVCFRKGFGVGSYVNEKSCRTRIQEEAQRIEAALRGELIKKVARDIEIMGLMNFKQLIRLNTLSKDLVRSIAARENIPRYSMMTREELINAVVAKGWQR